MVSEIRSLDEIVSAYDDPAAADARTQARREMLRGALHVALAAGALRIGVPPDAATGLWPSAIVDEHAKA